MWLSLQKERGIASALVVVEVVIEVVVAGKAVVKLL